MSKTGRCLCGAVTYAYDGAENWMGHCHCESCRRATSSAFTSFLGVSNGQWRWAGAAPKTYNSSPHVWRDFCGICRTQMADSAARYPDEIHFYAATLDDSSYYQPTGHVHWDEAVAWGTLRDNLERV